MITLSKFAKLAHVSVSTASKAFSMSNEVNEQTRQEIFRLAKELGCFKRFYNAKYPKFVVAVICPEFQSQYYSRTLSLIQSHLAAENCDVCVASTNFSFETQRLLLEYYNNYTSVDGVVVIGSIHTIENTYEIPIVCVTPLAPQHCPSIRIDYENSVDEIIGYFKNKNVDSIGFLGEVYTERKLAQFKQKMTHHFGDYNEDYIVTVEERFETGGYAAMNELFKKGKVPRAILCGYDYFAIGAIRCILDYGLSVPEDIAVVGINNIQETRYLNPPLTSISSRREVLCKTATDMMMKLLNNEPVDSEVIIESRIHMRKSTEIE